MKLYTEEQVKQIQQAILCNHKDAIMDDNYCLNVTKPIELPSDDEIQNMGKDVIVYNDTKRGWFVEGLRFMRDKIGGNNEQQ